MSETFCYTILGHAKTHLLDGETPKEQNLAQVVRVLQKVLKASTTARKEGLLALDDYISEIRKSTALLDTFLADALLLIVDGTDPEFVRGILSNKIAVQGPDTLEGYLFYIMMEGTLQIQAGVNPRIIEETMYSYLPLSLVGKVSTIIRKEQEEFSEEYKQQLIKEWNEYQPPETSNPFIGQFEERIAFYSDKEIQRILREVEYRDLQTVLAYGKKEVKDRISRNLSDNVKANLVDDLWFVSESDLTSALETVLRIMNRLEDCGEIREKGAKYDSSEDIILPDWLLGEEG